MSRLHKLLVSLLIAGVLPACVSTQYISANTTPTIKIEQDIPDSELLDIGIVRFDPGISSDEKDLEDLNSNPDVRKAEANFMPYTLRKTLEDTGNWGAVRVLPKDTGAVDLLVRGTILSSDGEILRLHIEAVDSLGREWLNKDYEDVASRFAYDHKYATLDEDPFQDMYNRIADDLLTVRQAFASDDLRRIRVVSRLKFAERMSPAIFNGFLSWDDNGILTVNRLPADGDAMMARVTKIREREYLLVDLIDEHYESYHQQMSQSYDDWRRFSYEEAIALRELKRAALGHKLLGAATVVGGIAISSQAESQSQANAGTAAILVGATIFGTGMDIKSQSKIHVEALKELSESFANEAQPLVFEVEGQTVTLTGTADAQFDEWRTLLRDIYESETGLDLAPEAGEDDADGGV